VRVIVSRRRPRSLPAIAKRLLQLVDEKNRVLRVTVTSATALCEGFCQALTKELETATQCKIVLERKEDPSLIGGVITRIGDHTIDGSIKGKLLELQRHLLQA
jgi:F-type H+-transporting ATPase subunit delta